MSFKEHLEASKTGEGREALSKDVAFWYHSRELLVSAATAVEQGAASARARLDDDIAVACHGVVFSTEAPIISGWTIAFRTLRNVCVECPASQAMVLSAGLIVPSLRFAVAGAELLRGDEGGATEVDQNFRALSLSLPACLQFLCNAATGTATTQAALWEALAVGSAGPALDLVVRCGRLGRSKSSKSPASRPALASAVALLHNCCHGQVPTSSNGPVPATAASTRLAEIAGDRALLGSLLRLPVVATPARDASSESGAGGGDEGGGDDATEWIGLLFGLLVRRGLLSEVWAAVGPGAHGGAQDDDGKATVSNSVPIIVTTEQVSQHVCTTRDQFIVTCIYACS